MTIKDKRSIFFLFVAMLASSLIIGSYCQTRFAPVDLTQYAESPASGKPSSHDEFSAQNKLSQKSENDDSNKNNSKNKENDKSKIKKLSDETLKKIQDN